MVELLISPSVNVSFPRGKHVKIRPSLLTPTPCKMPARKLDIKGRIGGAESPWANS